ncbi:MAG: hypothetical protein B7Z55_11145, partial [Planctomycetales bacterium 12-60-4]
LHRVRQLLSETDLSMSDIAQRTGFRHTEYLSVAFKRQFGISPSAFRQEHYSTASLGAGRSATEKSNTTGRSSVGAS